jgi:hypothetical protein
MTIERHSLEDVGTRWSHYSQLLDLWQDGLAIMQEQGIHGELDKNRADLLTSGIEMLQRHMDSLTEYNSKKYAFMRELDAAHNAGVESINGEKES